MSGRQLSYVKVRRELHKRLWHFPNGAALIDEALDAALPKAQRPGHVHKWGRWRDGQQSSSVRECRTCGAKQWD